ncbi:MAG: MFS transporter [Blastocatellia bacterium AA13]|nr:MAG: MFS transporter [Blastocatellia bacterium AA13]
MDAAIHVPSLSSEVIEDTRGIGGHPRGLTILFFTEMWERFSYYGMRALLVLFMVAPTAEGGLGFDTVKAAGIYGTYTGAVYFMSLPGGWVADKFLGARLAVLVGGISIALGHFSMAFSSLASFYAGLVLIVIGTGLLKPNISTMVGGLYSEEDPRRDGGFSVFYMGINIGAMISPLVCGFLARRPEFKALLGSFGIHLSSTWHWGFAAAGVGMTFGLVQYLYPKALPILIGFFGAFMGGFFLISAKPSVATLSTGSDTGLLVLSLAIGLAVGLLITWYVGKGEKKRSNGETAEHPLARVGLKPKKRKSKEEAALPKQKLTTDETKRIAVIGILFIFSALFWMAFEQAGSSLNLFADKLTRSSIFGWEFDATYFQSVNSIFIIVLAPVFSWVWLTMGRRQPSSPLKFSFGLIFAGLGFVLLAYASTFAVGGARVGPGWLIFVYLLHTIGELCLSPVGLSTTTKLAPTRLVGLMMGVWFLSISFGNYAGGWVAGFFDPTVEGALAKLFGAVALTTIAAGVVLIALTPSIKKLMGRVN